MLVVVFFKSTHEFLIMESPVFADSCYYSIRIFILNIVFPALSSPNGTRSVVTLLELLESEK